MKVEHFMRGNSKPVKLFKLEFKAIFKFLHLFAHKFIANLFIVILISEKKNLVAIKIMPLPVSHQKVRDTRGVINRKNIFMNKLKN